MGLKRKGGSFFGQRGWGDAEGICVHERGWRWGTRVGGGAGIQQSSELRISEYVVENIHKGGKTRRCSEGTNREGWKLPKTRGKEEKKREEEKEKING